MAKTILGLDLGTNSIGWALVKQDSEKQEAKILGMGSRIIPMSQEILGEFGKGNSISQTAARTGFRGTRRLRERHLLRRERLHRVLNIIDFLPKHYADQIDFDKKLGKFIDGSEPKLVYNNKDFIFRESFEEMLEDFRQKKPQLLINKNGEPALVPYDWTIYYLRKKALTQKINKHELAWIILNFNQKRGYYQLRGEEEDENPNKLVEFYSLKIVDVIPDEETNKKGETWYSLILENGWVYRRSSKTPLDDWKEKIKDFIVTTDLNDDGSIKLDKEGAEKRSFRAPKEDDWGLVKKKTEQEIEQTKKTVGEYIYVALLQNPKQKIKGKLVRTIERKFYKDELKAILENQIALQPELFTDDLYADCVRELYRNNDAHQLTLSKKGFLHLFLDDIIFYQRPLRSQKSSISNCSLEYRTYKVDGIEKKEYLKAIPKSNPYYQEFRVWQWLYNLKIYQNEDDKDVTNQFITSVEDQENLFEFLMNQKEVNHNDVLKYFFSDLKGKVLNQKITEYRWNYVFDSEKGESKKYPINETMYEINKRLNKVNGISPDFLTKDVEQKLWHIIYSVTDKKEFEKALSSFAKKHKLDINSFLENFKKFPPFKSDYGTFSEKAIKKLLPLLRTGKYWSWNEINDNTKNRIAKILTGEFDEDIRNQVREKAEKHKLANENDFQGLPLWLAQYVAYDRHSEANVAGKWKSISDLEKFIGDFKQHSLRNPIVEQVVTETLRVVKDIWQQYGKGANNFFSEIHVELARDMKHTADERKRLSSIITDNENTNLRVKALLIEMMNDNEAENVRPYSPMQQEILKIYEDGVLNSSIEIEEEILKISKKAEPTKSELQRYKLWLEQKYRSPYTGQIIPLNKLFTHEYEIEHIIPQSRFFDDSFTNKVICESAVNALKGNQIGLEFIKNHHGEKVPVGFGKEVQIFTEGQYLDFVKDNYAKNRSKRNKLLLEDIPEKMVERQLNDTRYISKFISNLLSNIVRSEKDDDGINSKNIIPGNGKITSELKQDWGLNDVWNELILPRFERMNELTKTNDFTTYNTKYQKYLPTVPFEFSKGFQKKRIDHRHHALDALVIACATREHVNYMNNKHALDKKKSKEEKQTFRHDLRSNLSYKKYNEGSDKNYSWVFKKPWGTFTQDARNSLETVVVSFKQNLRVINKATNKYEKWGEKNGEKKKVLFDQKGVNWAIRKSLHTPMPYGKKVYDFDLLKIYDSIGKRELIIDSIIREKVDLLFKENNSKISETQKCLKKSPIKDEYGNDVLVTAFRIKTEKYRKRQPISSLANRGQGGIKTTEDAIKYINKIADFKIRHDLLEHLKGCDFELEKAFSIEGLENFNSKREIHIYKVPIAESGKGRFSLGNSIGTTHKYVEADKGTNLFFAIYQDENGKRNYATIPLNEVIERQKQGLTSVPETNEKGDKLLFHLSPNDLVYVLNEGESVSNIDFENLTKKETARIHKMVSSSGGQCFFIGQNVATSIVNKMEFSTLNKMEKSINNVMIKEFCVNLKVDRLGNVSKVV